MVALQADGPDAIQALYAKAIELGATDEGEPGDRIPGVFYGAYVRDPDGNKLCFFQMSAPDPGRQTAAGCESTPRSVH